jgi:hypothetical protein
MKHWKEERNMLVPVPEALLPVAEELETLLQDLADSLSIYAHLAPKDDSREAAAMVLFQKWLEQHVAREEKQRALHRDYVEKLLAMLRAATFPGARNEPSTKLGCVQLMEDWWNATENDHFARTEGELQSQSICIGFSTDALLLEQIFHFRVEEFLCYYIHCLAGNGSDNTHKLAIYFLETPEASANIVLR